MSSPRPSHRDDFEVAIICALPLEYDAVSYIFDEFWDEDGDQYGRAVGDPNSYTTGRIGKYDVVLALLPHMGKTNAASATASMRSSYGGLRLALLVGVCGAMPCGQDGEGEVLLGDVVISKTVIQYDFGRQYPDRFIHKNTVEDNLGRPNKDLERRTAQCLRQLQAKVAQTRRRGKYDYPGPAEDRLFEPAYRHKHQVSPTCICSSCFSDLDPVCNEVLSLSCADLGCDDEQLITREQLQAKRQSEHDGSDTAQRPAVHVRAVASGDTVIKSATDRDRLSREAGVIAFKIEGAGVWDEVHCIVVKGVCDYADCHKHKGWQNFAAATAASASKAILEGYIQTDKALKAGHPPPRSIQPFSTVPFPPDPKFVERTDILLWLRDQTAQPGSRAALVGLGGIGKSQVAIHYAYEVRHASPDTWVFWVHASSSARFEEAYRNIADKLQLPGRDDPQRNVLQLVHAWLCDEENGPWMMVLDNADSVEVFFPRQGAHGSRDQPLASFLPKTGRGSIIITSRNTDAAERLAEKSQALQLLRNRLGECAEDDVVMTDLAAAYIKRRRPHMSVSAYVDEFRRSDRNKAALLGGGIVDLRRDESASNSIFTTWQITFEHIRHERPSAANLLSFMCFFNPQGIPDSVLRAYHSRKHGGGSGDKLDKELEVLCQYSLVAVTSQRDVFEMHPLVQFCTQLWLSSFADTQWWRKFLTARQYPSKEYKKWRQTFLQALSDQYPPGTYENWRECQTLDPHVDAVMKERPDNWSDIEKWARLLSNAAYYRLLRGKFDEAEQMNRRALDAQEKVLGREHPDTLTSVSNLAAVLQCQGKYEEAEQMNRQALDTKEKVLSRDHPATLRSVSNLALVLLCQGKYEEAEQMNRRALDANTLGSINNLASVLQYQGKYKEAEQINRQALNGYEKVLGREHPNTLTSGKYEEAEQINRRALDASEKMLGKEHPDTLISGKYEEAEQMNRRALDANTLRSSRFSEAAQLYERACSGYVEVLGSDHPTTRACVAQHCSLREDMANNVQK
ncbi:putative kinesin [Dactylonectria macrodidyma]|uniref:Kinesin n=1 Tax=Dactylonectria macrodidyma TaxID=307937 RepID=A0A9P9FVA7_9HYPO|nr:putative kinesin [Dactylonectria macrodidyma]